MAGNKVNAKAKGKDDKGKGSSKSIVPNNDETEDTDFSLLRKPIQTSITGFAQARKIFDLATEELKGLLSDECDLLYECKVCRNLFRSLANFISHKRVYCQNKFNSTVHGHFIKPSVTVNELMKIKQVEEGYQDSKKQVNGSEELEDDDRIPLTKDLTTIIEKIANNRGISDITNDTPQVTLHKIPSSTIAVFQNVDIEEKESESMRTQVIELDEILSRDIAVLQSDGTFKIGSSVTDESTNSPVESVIHISDDEEGGKTGKASKELKCQECDLRFATIKTLKFHMKYKHVDSRMAFTCPECLEIFATSWSVFRHLFKVHRKTSAQVRKLRETLQIKAFKMNNPPASYEKRKNMKTAQAPKITEEERLDQENQAWMDNVEFEGEAPRCGGCGRTFERRAALAAHTHTCQPRSRALRRPEGKRIEIQIRKDYNKGPTPPIVLPAKTDLNDSKTKTKDTKEPKEVREKNEDQPKIKPRKEPEPEVPERNEIAKEGSPDSAMQQSESESESKSPSVSPEKVDEEPPSAEEEAAKPVRLPFAQHAEKSNLMALRQRIIPDIELEELRCKKCDTRCAHIQELYDHVAKHYKWMRYACKLCNFKHYNFEKLPEHVKVVHKLKGDKDFYFSTVKAIDGTEASDLATPIEESTEADETSSNSRRPSRCSSDSSRLSDDSSSSSTRLEGAKKRKMTHKPSKAIGKRRKSKILNLKGNRETDEEWIEKDDSQSNVKVFEENSSDLDDTYERVARKRTEESVASGRPVRRKAKPKNADFEYDLSNLLKLEAQGYRDAQVVTPTTKLNQAKKKTQPDNYSNYEMMNKECCGALVSLSRKAVENAKAHMKTAATLYIRREKLPPNTFARPMIPKGLSKIDKISPRKEVIEEKKDSTSSNKEISNETMSVELEKSIATSSKQSTSATSTDNTQKSTEQSDAVTSTDNTQNSTEQSDAVTSTDDTQKSPEQSDAVSSGNTSATEQKKESDDSSTGPSEKANQKKITIPSVLPLKFQRQSIDVIKNNPIINKNITDFTKAGMKTKILVIKPLNRNTDGMQTVNTALKFQTIKLKETNKSGSSEDNSTDQVVVVKVPKVDCITLAVTEATKVPSETISVSTKTESTLSAPEEPKIEHEKTESTTDPPKNVEIHSDKNGDVNTKNAEPMEIDPMQAPDDDKLESNLDDSTADCDMNKMNTESNTKNVIAMASDEPANVSEKIDDSLKMSCD